jgi:hypothetical protein
LDRDQCLLGFIGLLWRGTERVCNWVKCLVKRARPILPLETRCRCVLLFILFFFLWKETAVSQTAALSASKRKALPNTSKFNTTANKKMTRHLYYACNPSDIKHPSLEKPVWYCVIAVFFYLEKYKINIF